MSESHIDRASVRFYTAHATHSRHGLSAPHSTFVGHLGIARAPVPSGGEGVTIQTSRGALEPEDRLLPSLEHVHAFCALHGSPSPARAEILTPPRSHGHRFAAMSVYLLYPTLTATSPSHFILEAGMATGESTICYPPCTVGAWQTVEAGYRPTPFSTPQQVFRGTFDTDPDAKDEPGRLVVEAYRSPYAPTPALRVAVRYEADAAPAAHPLWLRILAGARISAVADAMGRPVTLAARWLLRVVAAFTSWVESPARLPASGAELEASRPSHP